MGHKATHHIMGVLDDIQNKHLGNTFPTGIPTVMLIEIQVPSLRVQVRERLSEHESECVRLEKVCELEEHRILSLMQMELEQR